MSALTCTCCAPDTKMQIWHKAYQRWYEHHQAGHRIRSKVWGWTADRFCEIFWGREKR